MHDKKEWNPEHFDVNYYERSEKTPYGGFQVPYTWENFKNHAYAKIAFIRKYFGGFDIKTILFGGCAKGFEVRAAKELGYDAYGIDISEYALVHADPSVLSQCTLGSITDLSKFYKDDSFDLFASFDAWHTIHPDEREQAAKEISRITKKGILIRTGFCSGKQVGFISYDGDVEYIDPEFNGTYDGNPSYQDSIGLFFRRFEELGKFAGFFSPVVWDRDYFIWYSLCRSGNDMLRKNYGAGGGV
jgi:hypothetical protein